MKKILIHSKLPIFMLAFPLFLSEDPRPECNLPKNISHNCIHSPLPGPDLTNIAVIKNDDTTVTKRKRIIMETEKDGTTTKKIIINGDTLTRIGGGLPNFGFWESDSLLNGFNFQFNDQALNFQFKNFDLQNFNGHHLKLDSLMRGFNFHMDCQHSAGDDLKNLKRDIIINHKFMEEKNLHEEMDKMKNQMDSLRIELDKIKDKLTDEDK